MDESYERPDIHPSSTHWRPEEDYLGEDPEDRDPDADWNDDADGPIHVRINQPHVDEAVDGAYDLDYFSVDLVAGHAYVFHIRGAATDDGTLLNPFIGGLWLDRTVDGNTETVHVVSRQDDDGGHTNEQGGNAVLTYTPSESGRYYFSASASDWTLASATGDYSVEVYDVTNELSPLVSQQLFEQNQLVGVFEIR